MVWLIGQIVRLDCGVFGVTLLVHILSANFYAKKYQFYNWFVLGGKATSIETIYDMVEHFRLFPIYNKVALLDRPAKWNEPNTNICEK